jgi:hypothetical protein
MDFTKIKCNEDRIKLEWVERLQDDFSEHSVNSPNNALPTFLANMELLKENFLKLLELPTDETFLERVTIHTINISYSGVELNRCVIISGNIRTAKGSFNVNTPLQAMDNPDDISVNVLFNQKVEQVINEARKFVEGERAQGNLFQINAAVSSN